MDRLIYFLVWSYCHLEVDGVILVWVPTGWETPVNTVM